MLPTEWDNDEGACALGILMNFDNRMQP